MRFDDVKVTAFRHIAGPLLAHLNQKAGQRKACYGSFLHTGIQREHSRGVVFTHRHVRVDGVTPIQPSMLHNKDEDALCDAVVHGAHRSAPWAVAWIVLIRVETAVCVHVLQRRAHAPRIGDCNEFDFVIGSTKRRKCGFKSIKFCLPFKWVGFTGVVFKARAVRVYRVIFARVGSDVARG